MSVIVPAYNAARYIRRALDSALGQDYEHLEVVVVDDGSTDATPEVVRGVVDPRVVYLRQDNGGQGNARNRGIRNARGDLITFLDADDYYLPDKVARQVEFLAREGRYKAVYCNALHFDAGHPTVFYKKRATCRSGNLLPELLNAGFINVNTVMMTREVLERVGLFCETRYYPEDWEMWLRITLAGFEFGYLDGDLVIVEWRSESNTAMEIQWILKQHAVKMFRTLLPRAVQVDGVVYSATRTIRALQFKLALAYLLVGRRRESLTTLLDVMPSKMLAYLAASGLAPLPPWAVAALWRLWQRRHPGLVERVPASRLGLHFPWYGGAGSYD